MPGLSSLFLKDEIIRLGVCAVSVLNGLLLILSRLSLTTKFV